MDEAQCEMAVAQHELENASTGLLDAVRERRSAKGTEELTAPLQAAVVTARSTLAKAEYRLRTLYEARGE
jgi:hypothetical protein